MTPYNKAILSVLCSLLLPVSFCLAQTQTQTHDEHAHAATVHHQGHEEVDHEAHAAEDDAQQAHAGHDGHEEEGVHLSLTQIDTAGIEVESLALRTLPSSIEAPGEIRRNDYASSQVSPRIDSQVVERHARLGDHVTAGAPLVTLSSLVMAEAQGALLAAAKEWGRVETLGSKVVSERRYLEAQLSLQQAQARLLAYGLTQAQVDRLSAQGKIGQADGRFTLLAPQNGTVIRDDFVVGQMVPAGALLFELTDESQLWVEARVNPQDFALLRIGSPAQVLVYGEPFSAKLIQVHHQLDEVTRTLAVRLEIDNPQDNLHPGQFVMVRIDTGSPGEAALYLPLQAVLRSSDGDWQVFIEEEEGVFEPREVEILRHLPDHLEIGGLEPGTRVVTQGAFFLQSELAKAGFHVHNH